MRKDLIIHEAPKSPISEAIRTLRTSITYKMCKNNYKSFLITSSSTEDGKKSYYLKLSNCIFTV